MLRDLTEPNMIEQSVSIYLGSKPIPIYLLLLMLVFCQNYCFCYYSVNFFLYICYLSRTEKNKLKTFIDIHNTFFIATGFINKQYKLKDTLMKYHYSHRYAILKHKLQNNNVRISKQCIRVLFLSVVRATLYCHII